MTFFQEIHFTQQPQTGLISRFYRQVENRLKKASKEEKGKSKSPLKHFSGLKIMQQKSYGTFHGVQEQENVSYLQVDTAGSNNESTGGLNTQCKNVKILTKMS